MGVAELAYTLRAAARSGRYLTEKALTPLAGIDPASEGSGDLLGAMLAAINRAEDAAGRPLLSAVVVGPTGLPVATFYASARELGLHPGSDDDHAIWLRELRRVQSYWARH
jgi:hypothetical protein